MQWVKAYAAAFRIIDRDGDKVVQINQHGCHHYGKSPSPFLLEKLPSNEGGDDDM